jgi:hypothetical protein
MRVPYLRMKSGKRINIYVVFAIAVARLFNRNYVRVKRRNLWHVVWKKH